MTSAMRFFFSSRRRHTRWTGDWSSDVCSSDLALDSEAVVWPAGQHGQGRPGRADDQREAALADPGDRSGGERSEERRVGKECRCGWWKHHQKEKYREVAAKREKRKCAE